MKLIKSLTVFACAFALLVSVGIAEDKKEDKEAGKSCCEKAKAKGKECSHACCVEATKAGKTCEKCNPKKDDKKEGKKEEKK